MRKTLAKYYIQYKILKEKFLNEIFGNKNYKKFVIVSDSRTGSTLLMLLLNSHPNIIAEGELFKNLNGKSCESIWKKIFSKRQKRVRYVGFKLFYFHPSNTQDKKVWEFIEGDKSIKIIHLTRENILRSLVSKKIGLKTKKWTESINRSHNLQLEDKKVKLKLEECKTSFESVLRYQNQTKERFRNHKIIPVIYEDLDQDKQKIMSAIFSELGLPDFKIKTFMKKQNPEELKDLITNYSELENSFRNTKWKYLFSEKNSQIKQHNIDSNPY